MTVARFSVPLCLLLNGDILSFKGYYPTETDQPWSLYYIILYIQSWIYKISTVFCHDIN